MEYFKATHWTEKTIFKIGECKNKAYPVVTTHNPVVHMIGRSTIISIRELYMISSQKEFLLAKEFGI